MAIVLYDKAKNRRLFEISVKQRDQLVEALEEESATDRDYYIDATVIEFLEDKVDPELLDKLRPLVGAPPPADDDEDEDADAEDDGEGPPDGDGDGDDDDDEDEDEELEGLDIEWREE